MCYLQDRIAANILVDLFIKWESLSVIDHIKNKYVWTGDTGVFGGECGMGDVNTLFVFEFLKKNPSN